jgi:hypothetical protein
VPYSVPVYETAEPDEWSWCEIRVTDSGSVEFANLLTQEIVVTHDLSPEQARSVTDLIAWILYHYTDSDANA